MWPRLALNSKQALLSPSPKHCSWAEAIPSGFDTSFCQCVWLCLLVSMWGIWKWYLLRKSSETRNDWTHSLSLEGQPGKRYSSGTTGFEYESGSPREAGARGDGSAGAAGAGVRSKEPSEERTVQVWFSLENFKIENAKISLACLGFFPSLLCTAWQLIWVLSAPVLEILLTYWSPSLYRDSRS